MKIVKQSPAIYIPEFVNISGGDCGWKLLITKEDDKLVIGMYWGSKEIATHEAKVSLEEFKAALKALEDPE
jgi:hypothetical protein